MQRKVVNLQICVQALGSEYRGNIKIANRIKTYRHEGVYCLHFILAEKYQYVFIVVNIIFVASICLNIFSNELHDPIMIIKMATKL